MALQGFINASMRLLYACFKLFPTQASKIVMLSRQSDEMSLDFSLLREELLTRAPVMKIVFIGNRIKPSLTSKLYFAFELYRSLYHLATSKVCVLDSYWPAVSVLEHKPELVVIQIWHAMGKIKQSGKQTLGRSGGRDLKTAELMRMHEGYDYVIAGAPAWNPACCLSFGIDAAQILNLGLPRADLLHNHKGEIAERIYERYPDFSHRNPNRKTLVLYAPTFRRGGGDGYKELLKKFDFNNYNLIVKAHPNQDLEIGTAQALQVPEFSAFELLSVADYLITDYSAIAVEAAVAELKTLYYVYDYDEYVSNNGLNIDLFAEMPGAVFYSADEVLGALKAPYPKESLAAYKKRFVLEDLGHATKDIADLIFEKGNIESDR